MVRRLSLFLISTLILVLLKLPDAVQGRGKWTERKITWEDFKKEFGDESEQISVSEAEEILFQLTNEVRRNKGLSELAVNQLAGRVAYEHAKDMANNRYISHLNLDGEMPTMRFNRAGGTDNISENLAYWEWGIPSYLTEKLTRKIFEGWMESPPHRKNILDPIHNEIGISIYISSDHETTVMTAVQEFVDNYGDFVPIPKRTKAGQKIRLEGKIKPGYSLEAILVAYEPTPETKPPQVLNAELKGYSLPQPIFGILPTQFNRLKRLSNYPSLFLLTYDRSRNGFFAEISLSEAFQTLTKTEEIPIKARDALQEMPKPGVYYFLVLIRGSDGSSFISSAQTTLLK